MRAGQEDEVNRAVARRITPQPFDRLMSDEEVEFRHIVERDVQNEWPLAIAIDPDASVRFENPQPLLPKAQTAPQRDPDRHVRHEMARCIAAGESPNVFEDEDKSMQDLARAGMAAFEGELHE
ncbi:hypothetical protein [Bradyrhizobium sp. USDA 4506]